ncbi:MAG: OsmC family protein [Alistipes sp.]|nr:OsmC family protein [Alistipes sp.]
MATIETIYKGGLRTEATHVQSGNTITTDAPTDNNGRGEYFSPTDMVAAALGSCMLTIMDLTARRLEVDLTGTRLEIQKVMAADPRRICEIVIDFYIPGSYDEKTRKILENAAHTCPVSKSLHPDLKQTIRFHYA